MEFFSTSNSILNALIILLDNGVSSSKLISMNPKISQDLIKTISERSTACLVSDLYAKLFRGHRDEICNQKELNMSLKECSILWWTPIVNALESTDRLKRSYIYEVLFNLMITDLFFL